MFKKLQNLMDSHAETSETHVDESLRTHYFKTNKTAVLREIKKILENDSNFRELGYSEDRGEVTFEAMEPKNAFVVISVITVRANRTAVDITASTETSFPFNFGKNKRLIIKIYNELKNQLPFAGTSMAEKL
ncbi:cytosolic protein [Bacillus sp. NEB1478]|uniref:cytosolic protein n=1 Tax=Bacillus sp. NEB1478 TaxID=3073816 RepID=UPI0028739AD5|nr:cytosolic protein [Bacillus sp. NEB1478]WNB93180.1 cytosolic protein [Bacillus sp. NEB1478]